MIEPRYQELERKDISRGESENGGVEALGVATPVYTHPHHVCGLHHAPRVSPAPARPGGLECLRLRRRRRGRETATAHYCLVLGPGDGVNVWNRSTRPLRFVLVAGQPLGVPVVQHRPFVMNSHVEIQKAMEDYYYGKNDFERAGQWSSSA
jgi:quercetin 2,3-dioxygenase